MIITFKKYHGLQNDFLLIDGRTQTHQHTELQRSTPSWCDRHNTPYKGADGVVLIENSNSQDLKMTIWNADGSQAEMCGNAIRCIGLWAWQEGVAENTLSVETKAGPQHITYLETSKNKAVLKVDMGAPIWEPHHIPISLPDNKMNYSYTINNKAVELSCVSMGNPHAVIFQTENKLDPRVEGPVLEKAPLFPNKANIEFVTIKSPSEVDVIVWERGVGLTQACGTGACAVVAVGIRTQRLDTSCKVNLPGGALHIEQNENLHMMMTGPAEFVTEGSLAHV